MRRRVYTSMSSVIAPKKGDKPIVVQQQFIDDTAPATVVTNALRGVPPRFLAQGVPQYGDFSQGLDLAAAYEVIARAEEAFMNLPAELRLELKNDPSRVGHITAEQVERYRLKKVAPPPSDMQELTAAVSKLVSRMDEGLPPRQPDSDPLMAPEGPTVGSKVRSSKKS